MGFDHEIDGYGYFWAGIGMFGFDKFGIGMWIFGCSKADLTTCICVHYIEGLVHVYTPLRSATAHVIQLPHNRFLGVNKPIDAIL